MQVNTCAGSCADAGFSGCCVDDNCEITAAAVPLSCYCDVLCYEFNDCCDDIELIECHPHNSKLAQVYFAAYKNTVNRM